MKKTELKDLLNAELKRTYHNATPAMVNCDSDFESDLVQKEFDDMASMAIEDLQHECADILEYGKVYTWGRGGRTLAPQDLVTQLGGGAFRVKQVDNMDLTYNEMRKLYKTLKNFNDLVIKWNRETPQHALNSVRESFASELIENKNKKRQYYSGIRYI